MDLSRVDPGLGDIKNFIFTIIMTVNIPIIDIIVISAELTVTVLQALNCDITKSGCY